MRSLFKSQQTHLSDHFTLHKIHSKIKGLCNQIEVLQCHLYFDNRLPIFDTMGYFLLTFSNNQSNTFERRFTQWRLIKHNNFSLHTIFSVQKKSFLREKQNQHSCSICHVHFSIYLFTFYSPSFCIQCKNKN